MGIVTGETPVRRGGVPSTSCPGSTAAPSTDAAALPMGSSATLRIVKEGRALRRAAVEHNAKGGSYSLSNLPPRIREAPVPASHWRQSSKRLPYPFRRTASTTSPELGKRPTPNLEKTRSPSTVTSKIPPPPRMSLASTPKASRSSAASPAALGW